MSSATINGIANVSRFQVRIVCDVVSQNWIEVTSIQTGKTLVLDVDGISDPEFSEAENRLFERLCGLIDDRQDTMTRDDMLLFKNMVEKINSMRQAGANKPVAPLITNIQAVMMPAIPPACPQTNITAPSSLTDAHKREESRCVRSIEQSGVNRTSVRNWMLLQSDRVEDRIAGLLAVSEELKNREYWKVEVDIPTVIRQTVCAGVNDMLYSLGFVKTSESVVIGTLEMVRHPAFATIVDSIRQGWDRYIAYHESLPALLPSGAVNSRKKSIEVIQRERLAADRLVCEVEPLHPKLNATILSKVIASLDDNLRKAHTKLIETIARADDALAEAQKSLRNDETGEIITPTSKELEEAEKQRITAVRSVITSAVDEFSVALKGAEKFDCTMDVQDLLDALKAAIRAEASAFNARYRSTRMGRGGGVVKAAPSV